MLSLRFFVTIASKKDNNSLYQLQWIIKLNYKKLYEN